MTRFKLKTLVLKTLVKKISRHKSPNNSFYKFSTCEKLRKSLNFSLYKFSTN